MGTMTAKMLIGSGHPYHGGINPTHYLFLSENSRPAWVLLPQNIFETEDSKDFDKITWIPTIENMLKDALLMIAINVLKHKEICELAEKFFKNKDSDWVELYEDIEEADLEKLYEKCQEIDFDCKLIITAFEGSTIRNQLEVLENYKVELEVYS